MKKLILAAVAVASVSGCASVQEDVSVEDQPFVLQEDMLKGKTFVVTHMNGEYLEEHLSATMVFGEDNRLSGRGFCNMFMGDYEVNYEDVFETSKVLSTRRMCTEDRMSAESKFHNILRHQMMFEESELGYKVKSEAGSFSLMEIDAVTR